MPKKKTRTAPEPQTLQEAVVYFKDPDRALAYVVAHRWPNGEVKCPTCGSGAVLFLKNQRRWKCGNDHPRRQFSVKVGTVMEDSPIGLDKWMPALWMLTNCKNGISSYELARHLDVTQKTAWFLLHRLRLAMQQDSTKLGGGGKVVEADETWIGGKARSMNRRQKNKTATKHAGKPGPHAFSGKAIVLGMLERGGRVRTRIIPDTKAATIQPHIRQHVAKGSGLHTDEGGAYVSVDQPTELPEDFTPGDYPVDYIHEAVNHAAEEYVRGNVHTNGVENFWSLLKRGIRGTYVSVEPFHLFRYLDEQAFRFNERKRTDASRFAEALSLIVGKRLTYQHLIGAGREAHSPA